MKDQKLMIIIGLTLLGLILRIIFLMVMKGNWPGCDSPTIDALYHHLWAMQIADGNILGGGPYFRAPFYPYFLGLIYSIFGTNFTLVYLLQHIIGVLVVPLVFIISRNYFAPVTAIIAALLTAVNGILIYFESQLLLDFLTVIFFLVFIHFLTIAQKGGKSRFFLFAGLMAGLFAITRPNILAVIPLVCIWIFMIVPDMKIKIRNSLLLMIGIIIFVLPVTLRNITVGNDTVLIASQGGINFYIGNNEQADGYTAMLPGFGHTWQYSDADYEAASSLGKKPGAIKPSEVSSYYYDKAVKYIISSPVHFIKLLIKKLYLFWNRYEISNNNNIYFLTDYIGMSFYPLFLFAVISPLGLIGSILCFFKGRRFWIFPILIFGYMITVVMFFITARFRLPLVPILSIMTAFTIYEIYQAITNKRYRYSIILLISVFVAGVFTWTNFYGHHDSSTAMANYSLGNMFLKKGDYNSARQQYQTALEQASCVPNAHLNLGVIAFYESDTATARLEFEKEIKSCGPSAKAYNNLSMLARLKGDYNRAYAIADTAISYFPNFKEGFMNRITAAFALADTNVIKTAVSGFVDTFPEDIAARFYLGRFLYLTGKLENAEQEFRYIALSSDKDIVSEYDLSEIYSAALPYGYNPEKIRGKSFYHLGLMSVEKGEIDSALYNFKQAASLLPDDPDARHNLALAYDQKGDYQMALDEFRQAITLDSMKAVYYYNYALSLGKTGNYPMAVQMLEKTLSLDPEFDQAKNILQALNAQLNR